MDDERARDVGGMGDGSLGRAVAPPGPGSPSGVAPRWALVAGAVAIALVIGFVAFRGWQTANRSCSDRLVDAVNATPVAELRANPESVMSKEGLDQCRDYHPTPEETAAMMARLSPEARAALASNAKPKVTPVQPTGSVVR